MKVHLNLLLVMWTYQVYSCRRNGRSFPVLNAHPTLQSPRNQPLLIVQIKFHLFGSHPITPSQHPVLILCTTRHYVVFFWLIFDCLSCSTRKFHKSKIFNVCFTILSIIQAQTRSSNICIIFNKPIFLYYMYSEGSVMWKAFLKWDKS